MVNAKSQTLTVAGAATASNRVPFLPSLEGPKTNAHEHVKVELVKNDGIKGGPLEQLASTPVFRV